MDKRRYEKMKRGKLRPDARVDLHGMTAEQAFGVLNGFILSAHASGHRLVLVITGKGKPARDSYGASQYGVLRHNVPHWLNSPRLAGKILQVESAHQRHGGDGAFYVYLRR
ncbi:Smr/MutS family protein [Amaricoccus tamworthensis]|uniref:Smr/MutS family protein n=1 Tax=Amaricoccus tamworthensis TaxID=57002 RepID=UPI003C7DEACF